MGFAETMIFYLLFGVGVAVAVFLSDARRSRLSPVFRVATAPLAHYIERVAETAAEQHVPQNFFYRLRVIVCHRRFTFQHHAATSGTQGRRRETNRRRFGR